MDDATRVLTKTLIQRVQRLLEKQERWTKGVSARDANGASTYPSSDNACSWCLTGALDAVALNGDRYIAGNLVQDAVQARGYSNIPAFNDAPETTHYDVLSVLAEADARV